MMNTEKQPLLLLPLDQQLIIRNVENKLVIAEIPGWLADYLGHGPQELTGEAVESVLEPAIPGIGELVSRTRDATPMSGFRVTMTDAHGKIHHLILDSIRKPGKENEGLTIILLQEVSAILPAVVENATFCGLIGASEPMERVFNQIRMYAMSDAAVLVSGETGAGKEGVAAAIHQLSNRSQGPFITMNCSAITDTLFESELFGHEKGSFTGAIKSHRGRFERANRGTLFLDEVGDLPPASQAKLLRVLETSQFERVGSETPVNVDVRIIAATNHNLEKECLANTFRPDLYYRISALQIGVPPLRNRADDIELLIQHFIKVLNHKYERNIACLTRPAVQLLKQYHWPGNVRELRNLMERLFAENQADVIGLRSLKDWYEERMIASRYAIGEGYTEVAVTPYRQIIPLGMPDEKKLTAENLRNAYSVAGGNITRASEILGIHKATFYRALKSLNLEREDLAE